MPLNTSFSSPASNSSAASSTTTAVGSTSNTQTSVVIDNIAPSLAPVMQFNTPMVIAKEDDNVEISNLVSAWAETMTTDSSIIPLTTVHINDHNIVEIIDMLDAKSLESKIDDLILLQLYKRVEANSDSTNTEDILKVVNSEIDIASSQLTSARSFYMSLLKVEKSLKRDIFLKKVTEVTNNNLESLLNIGGGDLDLDFLDRLSKITGISKLSLESQTLTAIYYRVLVGMKDLLEKLPHKFAMSIEYSLKDLPSLESVGIGDDPYDGFVNGPNATKETYYDTHQLSYTEKVMHTCMLLSKEFQMSAGLGRITNTQLGMTLGATGDYIGNMFGHSAEVGDIGLLPALATAGINGDTKSSNVLLFEDTKELNKFDAVTMWVDSLKVDPLNNYMDSYSDAIGHAENVFSDTGQFFSKLLLIDADAGSILTPSGLFTRIIGSFSKMVRGASAGVPKHVLSLLIARQAEAVSPKARWAALGRQNLQNWILHHTADYHARQNENPKLRITSNSSFVSGSFQSEDPITIINNLRTELDVHEKDSEVEEGGLGAAINVKQEQVLNAAALEKKTQRNLRSVNLNFVVWESHLKKHRDSLPDLLEEIAKAKFKKHEWHSIESELNEGMAWGILSTIWSGFSFVATGGASLALQSSLLAGSISLGQAYRDAKRKRRAYQKKEQQCRFLRKHLKDHLIPQAVKQVGIWRTEKNKRRSLWEVEYEKLKVLAAELQAIKVELQNETADNEEVADALKRRIQTLTVLNYIKWFEIETSDTGKASQLLNAGAASFSKINVDVYNQLLEPEPDSLIDAAVSIYEDLQDEADKKAKMDDETATFTRGSNLVTRSSGLDAGLTLSFILGCFYNLTREFVTIEMARLPFSLPETFLLPGYDAHVVLADSRKAAVPLVDIANLLDSVVGGIEASSLDSVISESGAVLSAASIDKGTQVGASNVVTPEYLVNLLNDNLLNIEDDVMELHIMAQSMFESLKAATSELSNTGKVLKLLNSENDVDIPIPENIQHLFKLFKERPDFMQNLNLEQIGNARKRLEKFKGADTSPYKLDTIHDEIINSIKLLLESKKGEFKRPSILFLALGDTTVNTSLKESVLSKKDALINFKLSKENEIYTEAIYEDINKEFALKFIIDESSFSDIFKSDNPPTTLNDLVVSLRYFILGKENSMTGNEIINAESESRDRLFNLVESFLFKKMLEILTEMAFSSEKMQQSALTKKGNIKDLFNEFVAAINPAQNTGADFASMFFQPTEGDDVNIPTLDKISGLLEPKKIISFDKIIWQPPDINHSQVGTLYNLLSTKPFYAGMVNSTVFSSSAFDSVYAMIVDLEGFNVDVTSLSESLKEKINENNFNIETLRITAEFGEV